MQVAERRSQSWIWLVLGLILLCAATIHGRSLLSREPEGMGPGRYYSLVQVSSLPDDNPHPPAGTSADVLENGGQSLFGPSVFGGKTISRIYAAMMRAKSVPELGN